MKENNIVCANCEEVLMSETATEFDGRVLCSSCLRTLTAICDCCGDRIWNDDVNGDDHITLCGHCYDRHYTECEGCGCVIHNDNAFYEDDSDYPYCYECFQKLNNHPIKSYNYKPEPDFFGSDSLYMGVELEIDKGGEDDENAKALLDIANVEQDRIYCKHDGSLNEGFEIVSHPMTLEYHTEKMNWQEIFEQAIQMEYRSHNTATCGLHIHVNRSAFGQNKEEQEETVGRIVFFVEKHWNELVKFSRRTPQNLNHWAAKYASISDTTRETYKKAKDKRLGRYVAINLENYHTVEFRLFRGTLRYSTFVAVLQLVHEICRFAIQMSDGAMEEMSWSDFVTRIPNDKKELIDYLKSKRLYVNELPEEMEEF